VRLRKRPGHSEAKYSHRFLSRGIDVCGDVHCCDSFLLEFADPFLGH
jgi:hypothetical protein